MLLRKLMLVLLFMVTPNVAEAYYGNYYMPRFYQPRVPYQYYPRTSGYNQWITPIRRDSRYRYRYIMTSGGRVYRTYGGY
jgi:hypothetical protein